MVIYFQRKPYLDTSLKWRHTPYLLAKPLGTLFSLYSNSLYDSYDGSVEKIKLMQVAHELKLPLFNIKSFLETLYEHNFKLTDTQRLEFLETATKETNRLIFLINNLIELQSISSTDLLFKEYFQLSDLILQVVNSHKLVAKSKKIHLFYDLKYIENFIYGNSDLVGQIINNLVGNSLKYTFIGKNISIRTRLFTSIFVFNPKKKKIHLSILDQGIGISKVEINEINRNTFYKKSAHSGITVKGNGLGLKIVKQILLFHTSRIVLLSKLGKGSLIGFSLEFYPKISW